MPATIKTRQIIEALEHRRQEAFHLHQDRSHTGPGAAESFRVLQAHCPSSFKKPGDEQLDPGHRIF